MPPSKDRLAAALEPLNERALLPEEYRTLGLNVIEAANIPRIRKKYDLTEDSSEEGEAIVWSREGTGYVLQEMGPAYLLFASRTTSTGIRLTNLFAFGDLQVVPKGISRLVRDASRIELVPEITPKRLLWLAREQGTLRRHDSALLRRNPTSFEKSSFRRDLRTIATPPDDAALM